MLSDREGYRMTEGQLDAMLAKARAEGERAGRAAAFAEAAEKAREWAAHYSQGSDGRNTFVLFAEWAESRSEGERTP